MPIDTALGPEEDAVRAELAEPVAGHSRVHYPNGMWLVVEDPAFRLPPQGWKIHLAARPATLLETLRRSLPAVLSVPCHFKVIRSGRLLRDLNSSNNHPGSIGKAVTVYAGERDVVGLARRLAADLAGLEGPRVYSDRRVAPDAPVYYRYGPFRAAYDDNDDGDLELVVTGPDGRTLPGAAGESFWQPPWTPDPFVTVAVRGQEPQPVREAERVVPEGDVDVAVVMLGGRYRVVRALTRNGKGIVYRAVDTTGNREVIIKEARAFVNEDSRGRDSRARLRNERYVLEKLRGLDGVPAVVDHFRHDDREYLAITDMGALALGRDVAENGLYTADPAPCGRSLPRLAAALAELLDQVHERGVLVRDISPTNIVLDSATGRPCLVDFEISHAEGPQIFGWTPGYSPPEQERDEPATVEADYYSLGATLFYAATGLPPTWLTDDPHNHDIERAAALLDGRGGISDTILGLLAADPAQRQMAADALRSRRLFGEPAPVPSSHACSSAPEPSAAGERTGRLNAAIEHSITEVSRYTVRLMTGADLTGGVVASPVNIYRGSAGMGMELLHHGPTRDLARALAYWTNGLRTLRRGRPAFYTGDTGIAVFVTAAGVALNDDVLMSLAAPMARPVLSRVTGDDQHNGLAGIGTGQLLLWRLTDDADRLDLASGCAERLLTSDPVPTEEPPDYADCGQVSRTLGFSHGLAGIVHFLLAYRTTAEGHTVEPALRKRCDLLAQHLVPLIDAARSPSAKPMHASFCQGLAGIGAALLRAAHELGEDGHLELTLDAAAACRDLAPRMYALTQCCGLAGIGEFFLDLVQVTGDRTHLSQAHRVADLIINRAGGPADAPVFPDTSLHGSSGSWSTGTAGVLSFLRRLRDPGSPRLWLDPVAL
ncbi:class IV lanthionine synthetase LanL [Actinoallomurus sp. NBC_01490]|uniref:class IV lanthionine synthetase LanL n=1 Tax=Actinoallomurus sp. NBC_01490 TaxID=2903557 RepID=UPI002E3152E9|nr:class IV lanthionine synthetase LanL [Actinoallomurus sp. NBC_01490]